MQHNKPVFYRDRFCRSITPAMNIVRIMEKVKGYIAEACDLTVITVYISEKLSAFPELTFTE